MILPLTLGAGMLGIWLLVAWPWLKTPATRDKAVTLSLVAWFLSIALYLHVGSPFLAGELAHQQESQTAIRQEMLRLQEKTDKNGVDWAQLGAAYITAERYTEAESALKEAVKLTEGQPELILLYGKAQMMAADGEITEGAKQAFEMAARLMPDNPDPLLMLAMERMQAGDKPAARAYMQKLLPMLPDAAPIKRMIQQRLKETE